MSYKQWLKQFCDDLFSAAYDEDICGFRSTNALATEAELSHSTVARLESGETKRPSLYTIRQLCIATGTDTRIVMGDMRRTQRKRRAA